MLAWLFLGYSGFLPLSKKDGWQKQSDKLGWSPLKGWRLETLHVQEINYVNSGIGSLTFVIFNKTQLSKLSDSEKEVHSFLRLHSALSNCTVLERTAVVELGTAFQSQE